jgi:hypothetical protein
MNDRLCLISVSSERTTSVRNGVLCSESGRCCNQPSLRLAAKWAPRQTKLSQESFDQSCSVMSAIRGQQGGAHVIRHMHALSRHDAFVHGTSAGLRDSWQITEVWSIDIHTRALTISCLLMALAAIIYRRNDATSCGRTDAYKRASGVLHLRDMAGCTHHR